MNEENNKPFRVYCNEINLVMSHYDFIFEIREILPNNLKVTHGTITLSPQHAKIFLNVLANNIKQYEELFGEIPIMDQAKFESLKSKGIIRVDEH